MTYFLFYTVLIFTIFIVLCVLYSMEFQLDFHFALILADKPTSSLYAYKDCLAPSKVIKQKVDVITIWNTVLSYLIPIQRQRL